MVTIGGSFEMSVRISRVIFERIGIVLKGLSDFIVSYVRVGI